MLQYSFRVNGGCRSNDATQLHHHICFDMVLWCGMNLQYFGVKRRRKDSMLNFSCHLHMRYTCISYQYPAFHNGLLRTMKASYTVAEGDLVMRIQHYQPAIRLAWLVRLHQLSLLPHYYHHHSIFLHFSGSGSRSCSYLFLYWLSYVLLLLLLLILL